MAWQIKLICCGRDEGRQIVSTWKEADKFRNTYIDAEGHDRQGIVSEVDTDDRGWYSSQIPTPIDPDDIAAVSSIDDWIEKYNELLEYVASQNGYRWDGWDWVQDRVQEGVQDE